MFLIPEGFYVVCISLFEFGFGDAIIYFLLVGVMIGIHIYIYIYIYIYTQQQTFCQLVSKRMKEKPLGGNTILPDAETKKLVHPFTFI